MLRTLPLLLAIGCRPTDDVFGDTGDLDPGVSATLTFANVAADGQLVASDGSTHDPKLAPGLVIVHTADFALFTVGEPISRPEREPFAEGGDPASLVSALADDPDVLSVAWLTKRDETSYEAAPLLPGDSVSAAIEVVAGNRVTVAAMFGESNDTVVAALGFDPFDGDAIADEGVPLAAYDLGTEVDQEPGLGADQAPRQSAPNTGESESVPVDEVGTSHDGFDWMPVDSYARLSIAPG